VPEVPVFFIYRLCQVCSSTLIAGIFSGVETTTRASKQEQQNRGEKILPYIKINKMCITSRAKDEMTKYIGSHLGQFRRSGQVE
jgi:hypothetical protein